MSNIHKNSISVWVCEFESEQCSWEQFFSNQSKSLALDIGFLPRSVSSMGLHLLSGGLSGEAPSPPRRRHLPIHHQPILAMAPLTCAQQRLKNI